MKEFTVRTGNGSTYNYMAEFMEVHGEFFHFVADGKIVGVQSKYGVVSISDRPCNQRYV